MGLNSCARGSRCLGFDVEEGEGKRKPALLLMPVDETMVVAAEPAFLILPFAAAAVSRMKPLPPSLPINRKKSKWRKELGRTHHW